MKENEELMKAFKKFKEFAKSKGYHHPLPDGSIGFMNTKTGDVLMLAGKKEAIIIRKNDVTEAEYVR